MMKSLKVPLRSVFIVFLLSGGFLPLYSQQVVNINPRSERQKLEGWGVSLAWWAHIAGQKATPQQLDELVRWLTAKDELNMNIFRFNIGGGDAPGHMHMRKDAQLPGYRPVEGGPYDWDADSAQRRVLLAIKRVRPDAIYEGESYSPPYWMTETGCTSGGEKGVSNLKEGYYDRFADYLTEVTKHYKDAYGIVFRTIAPVNEPFSNWWKKNGSQEGCAFSAEQQARLVKELRASLQAKGMLPYTSISLNDANSIDECVRGLRGSQAAELLASVNQINTHSYAGVERRALFEIASKNGKRLWQSESGPLNMKERGWDNFLAMGKRIITDMRELQPVAWCDWQYMSGGGLQDVWALAGYIDSSFRYERTKGYYCREQFSRFIRPGYVFIESGSDNTLAALSPDKKELVLVVVNQENKEEIISLDLSPFRRIKNKSIYLTDNARNCSLQPILPPGVKNQVGYTCPAKSVSTLIFQVGL